MYYSFNKHGQNSRHAGHQLGHTFQWDGIPFLNQLKLIPQVFSGGEVRTSFPKVFSDKLCSVAQSVQSQTVEIWGLPLVAESHINIFCIANASSDEKPRFSSEGDASISHQTASTKSYQSIGAANIIVFSALSPHFWPDFLLRMAEQNVLHIFRFQMLPTLAYTILTVEGSHDRSPGSPINWRCLCPVCSGLQICRRLPMTPKYCQS